MITQLKIKNFRQIEDQSLDLSQAVVVVGPNNGGKTTLLQAISLFAISLREWGVHRLNKKSKATKRTGVAINFENLLNIPVSDFKEIWCNLNVREADKNKDGKTIPKNIRIEIHAEGYTKGEQWRVGFEYDYGRDSLIYARLTNDDEGNPYEFPEILLEEKIGYLPSVASLQPTEDKLEVGSILRKIGNGNTSDVLRNMCYLLYDQEDKSKWDELVSNIKSIFRVSLNNPVYVPATGLLKMSYREEGVNKDMDLASLGSGAKQAILLFAYILAFPNTVNLLDEPDAHLEFVRQSNIYNILGDIAKRNNSQIVVASHSESVINSAFSKDMLMSSVFGKFEQLNQNKNKKVEGFLKNYGYQEYIIARQRGCILYYEGNTDLEFIKAFADILDMSELTEILNHKIYARSVGGNDARFIFKHFDAIKAYVPELKGFALFDNLNKEIKNEIDGLKITQWQRNEIENYIPIPSTLRNYMEKAWPVFKQQFEKRMTYATSPKALDNPHDEFWVKTKISDDYLTPLFEGFWDEMELPRNTMDKSKYYLLCDYINPNELQQELIDTLNLLKDHLS